MNSRVFGRTECNAKVAGHKRGLAILAVAVPRTTLPTALGQALFKALRRLELGLLQRLHSATITLSFPSHSWSDVPYGLLTPTHCGPH